MTQAPLRIVNKPSFIQHGRLRFLIIDAPNDANLPLYIKEMNQRTVKDVVRTCEPTYSTAPLEAVGIQCHDMEFPDGDAPPPAVIKRWMALVRERFHASKDDTGQAIAIHCLAGLGRAPVLVTIALIHEGMDALDAIELIRQKRKGAINARQLKFLESYNVKSKNCCVMM
eukprot:GILI01004907.1.p1 GENE.GILI01004907.1~~GILI01004907.1.p1  ORF type:complete len:170 (+),score=15.64 GILI01004907.1:162-671(+)